MGGYTSKVPRIVDGRPVSAGVTNTPIEVLAQNVQYLKDRLDGAELGKAIILRDVSVEANALAGQPVYFNAASQKYLRALGQADTDPITGELHPADSSLPWGLVLSKSTSEVADILVHGVADINLSNAISGDVEAGLYYLSNSTLGGLVRNKPPVGIPVALVGAENADGTFSVYVNVQLRDMLEAHQHYRFELAAVPAGTHTPPAEGNRHEITDADTDVEGWLPADDPSFSGLAPEGAAFGYNLAASRLNDFWPPLPLAGVYLEMNRGESSSVLGMGVPAGESQLVVFDRNGIWWMSDCYGDVPWPTLYDSASPTSLSNSLLECPRELSMTLTLWFSRPTFHTRNTAVLSLEAAEGSGLSITCADTGEPASTGHLLIDNSESLTVDADTTQTGHLVFKTLTNRTLKKGPVVEALVAGNANVTLSSSLGALPQSGRAQGVVTISVDTDIDSTELPISTVRLDGVTQEYYQDILGLGFSSGRESSLRGSVRISNKTALDAGTTFKLRFWLLGRIAGSVPEDVLTLTYRVVPAPSALASPESLPTTDTALAMDCAVVLTADNQYFTIESDSFEVAAGDLIFFTLTRADDDTYDGELHVINQMGVLAAAP